MSEQQNLAVVQEQMDAAFVRGDISTILAISADEDVNRR
jgi:hypothetical protein